MDDYEIAKDKREQEDDRIHSLADVIYDRDGVGSKKDRKEYGLCGRCKYLCYQRSKLNTEYVWCGDGDDKVRVTMIKPNKIDPIIDCSFFSPIGFMNMWDMNRIAWRIDIEDEEALGFGGVKNRVVKITKP